MRGLPTVIGSIFEVALAYIKLESQLSSKISWPIAILLAIIAALTEILTKPKLAIKIKGDRNIIDDNVTETGNVEVEGSENLIIRSSSIPSTYRPIFESFIVFLVIAIIMFLMFWAANIGFGQLKR